MPAERPMTEPQLARELRTLLADAEEANRLTRVLTERDVLEDPEGFVITLHQRGAVLSRMRDMHAHLEPFLRGPAPRPEAEAAVRKAVGLVREAGERLLEHIGERKKEVLAALHEVERRELLMKYVR
jgi:hypothetical protein